MTVPKYRKRMPLCEAKQAISPLLIQTPDGLKRADPSDWVVTEPDGTQYVFKDDLFKVIWERVESEDQ